MEALRYHRFMKASAKSRTTKPQSLAPTESVFFSDFFFFFKFTHKKNKNNIYNIWRKHSIIVWNYPIEESDNKYTLNQNIIYITFISLNV